MTAFSTLALEHPVCSRLLGAGAVLGFYALSFFLPALRDASGGEVFLFVLSSLVGMELPLRPDENYLPLYFLGFLPNPLLWVGIILLALGWRRGAAAVGAVALALGLIWAFDWNHARLELRSLNVGYFCWLASMATLAVSAWTLHLVARGSTINPAPAEGETA